MLKIENVSKTYGTKKAVDGLTLHIQAGEIYGFIGHNGAGKTTTIKACCGILGFEEGEIYVDGTSIKTDPLACKAKIAYIPDDPELYGFMTGIQFLNQKLAIISALLHEPKLIIMDKPFVGLDPKAAHTVKAIMRDMCDRGSAIFFSTHVLEVAEKLCDKVAIIKGGKLVKAGTVDEVKGDVSLEEVFLELAEDGDA